MGLTRRSVCAGYFERFWVIGCVSKNQHSTKLFGSFCKSMFAKYFISLKFTSIAFTL